MEASSTERGAKGEPAVPARLSDEQERTLAALLNAMIPPSKDGRMPGAAEVGFVAYLESRRLIEWLQGGLAALAEASRNAQGREFWALDQAKQTAVFDGFRRRHFRFFGELCTHVIQCYYEDDRVLEAIGLEARPPFALGYVVEEGDLTLLEPVEGRGKIYRE